MGLQRIKRSWWSFEVNVRGTHGKFSVMRKRLRGRSGKGRTVILDVDFTDARSDNVTNIGNGGIPRSERGTPEILG